jgi:hypothetical protein
MRSNRVGTLLLVVALGVLGLGLGFDFDRPSIADRLLRLELELGAALDERDEARAEAEALAVEVEELVETLAVEQMHLEEAEAELAKCKGQQARDNASAESTDPTGGNVEE